MTEAAKQEQQAVELQPILEGHVPSSGRTDKLVTAVHKWWQNKIVRVAVRNLALILLWYTLSTALTFWNKYLVSKDKDGFFHKGPFPAPLLVSALQFFAQHVVARAVIEAGLSQRKQSQQDWASYLKTVVPNGVATGLDIGFSNYSYVFVTISFYVMCKSTTPLFLLMFAIAWGIEKASWSLAGVVLVIFTGLMLLVAGETEFNLVGFLLVMSAALLAGLRWTITQVQLQGHKAAGHGAGSPTEVIFQLTPIMGATVLLLSLAVEKLWVTLPASPYFNSLWAVIVTLGIVSAGGLLAFAMVWAEFKLIKCTSALTFMVAGTFKEIFTVMAGVMVEGDSFTFVKAIGLGVLILGVILFNMQKYHKMRQGELKPLRVTIDDTEDGEGSGLHKYGSGDSAAVVGAAPGSPTRAMLRRGSWNGGVGGGVGEGGSLAPWPASSAAGRRSVFVIQDSDGEEEGSGSGSGEEGAMLLQRPSTAGGSTRRQQGGALGLGAHASSDPPERLQRRESV